MIRKLQIAYFAVLALPAIYFLLTQFEVLPEQFMAPTAETQYALDLIALVACLSGAFLAPSLFTFKPVKHALRANPDKGYARFAKVRLALNAFAIWTTLFVYSGSARGESAKYMLLIALIGALFCFPSKSEPLILKEKLEREEDEA